ncbi:MAG: PIG-L family deacetylase [Clostridia bacterium]|nr:PIG-L family deacetylase [Clostridia bacterium]
MRMKLRIIAFLAVIAMVICMSPALAVQADTVTKQCTFEVSRGKAKYLTDGDYETVWEPSRSGEKLLVTLPPNGAGSIVVEWQDEPVNYMFEEYDAEKVKIASADHTAFGGGVVQMMPVSENTRYVLLTLAAGDQGICEISVYSKGDMPESVQDWYGEYLKCDMLLVAAYPGDELATFGGLLPKYATEKEAKVQLVYMTDMGRERKAETLDALWSLGQSNYPVFMDLKKGSVSSMEDCLRNWGGKDALIGKMVEVIRRCKPEIIVSHDINGENDDYRRALTGMLMEYAVKAAADPEAYSDSLELHGAWQAKKLYLHLGATGLVNVDLDTPAEALGGLTANEAAAMAFENYESLAGKYAVAENASVYSLIYSTIGDDTKRNDLFENVPGLDVEDGDAPESTPEPTAAPTFAPALVFSPEPTVTARPALGEVDGFSDSAVQVFKFVGIGLGAILAITCLQAIIYQMRGRRRRRWY